MVVFAAVQAGDRFWVGAAKDSVSGGAARATPGDRPIGLAEAEAAGLGGAGDAGVSRPMIASGLSDAVATAGFPGELAVRACPTTAEGRAATAGPAAGVPLAVEPPNLLAGGMSG